MRYNKYIIQFAFLPLLVFLGITSCKKYLDKKPLQSQYIPSTLNDLQALLDNSTLLNQQSTPPSLELVADNYYMTTSGWESLVGIVEDPENYIWDKDAVYTYSWTQPYQAGIYNANIALDVLPTIAVNEANRSYWNQVKGTALFFRSFNFYQLSQLYCRPYSSTADTDLGIVLKLTSSIGERIIRSNVEDTYKRIINDLKEAAELLPETSTFPTRPTKAAAYGMLARAYLSMREYLNAGHCADLSLQIKNVLMDYNNLVPLSNPIIPPFNPEIVFYNYPTPIGGLSNTRAKIDSTLYQSYESNDLRKTVFFNVNTGVDAGTYGFQGSYASIVSNYVFDGITTDEMYLIRAESSARLSLKDSAMADLNRLLVTRWKKNSGVTTYVNMTAATSEEALQKVLTERRKELIYRGLRWSDLRRFNVEGAAITLKRIIGGVTYTLPPDDLRWVMLIPPDVITHSGIEQNLR